MANYGHGEHYEIMRSKMLYTAAQLFLQKGYAMTSLKEISAEAGTIRVFLHGHSVARKIFSPFWLNMFWRNSSETQEK